MSYNIKQWLTNSGVELARGAAAGMAITVVVFFCFWTPPPTPRIGEKQATVIMQYGPPDEIVATEQSPTERQHYPYTYLRYRIGVQAGNFRCLDKGAPFIFVRVIVL